MKYKFRMRTKILLLCLGSTMLALLLQTFLFQNSSSRLIYNQAKEERFNSLQNMQNDIDRFTKVIESNLINVYNEKEFMQSLRKKEKIEDLRSNYYRLAYNMGTKQFATTDGVVALYFYTNEHQIISIYRRAVTPKHNYQTDIYNDVEGQNAKIVKDYIDSDDTIMLVSSYFNQYRNKDIIRFVLKVYNNSNLRNQLGYIVCDVDSKVIRTIMEKYSLGEEMFMWLQPAGDRPLLAIGNLEEADEKDFQELADKIHTSSNGKFEDLDSSERVFFQVDQKKYNIGAYTFMPQYLLEQNQKSLTQNLLLIATIMLVITIFLNILVSSNLTRPLVKLTQTIERIRKGETQLRVHITNGDEIGELGQSFNDMLDEMEVLISKEYEAKLMMNQAEYKALQAQINPHFLYNTLDTMSSIAEVQNCTQVSSLSQSLSNIFRYSLDMKNPFTTVAKEIVHLKNYIYVMDVRMMGTVKYKFEIDEQVLQDSIPRITIQPLVENALNHGLRNQKGEKEIIVRAQNVNDNLEISVQDNGVGMSAQKVKAILEERETDEKEKGTSIGLSNINSRIKMLYRENVGIRIESELDRGTKVFLLVPRVKIEEIGIWMQGPIKS